MATRRSAPAPELRERLLRAGLTLARRKGFKALTVRAVAAEAQANLGSFVYHFGSRAAFVDELIERWYAPLFARLQLTAASTAAGGDPLEALRSALLQLVAWVVDNRAMMARLVLDAGAGEPGALHFLRGLDQRHPALLLQLIAQAQQAGRLRRDDPLHQMMFVMTTLAVPVLVFQLLGQRGMAPPPMVRALSALSTDDTQIRSRLDWALRGLAP